MELMVDKYKQTEVGFIPDDWNVKELGELGSVLAGLTYSPDDVSEFGTLVLRSSNIQNNQLAYENNVFVTMQLPERVIVKEGDLLICVRNGSRNLIGKSVLIDKSASGSAFGAFMAIFRSEDNTYISKLFQSNILQKQIENNLGATINQITNKDLKSFKVPLPPTKSEQTAIATALSDMDALISNLEKLIEKKRRIKQGAMQELLKPKEGWERKTLKELVRYRRGSFPQPYGLDKWYDDIAGAPFVQVFDVNDNFKLKEETKRKISKEAQSLSVFIEKGSVIITLQGSIGRIAITQYDAFVDRTLLIFETFIIPFNKYFFALSVYLLFEKEKEKAPGGTIKTITKEALSSFTIAYPKIETQNEIAKMLSDIESEIESLESFLRKQKNIKHGMMQSLLTGKIRLI